MNVVRPGEKFDLVAKNELGERTFASPALSDGQRAVALQACKEGLAPEMTEDAIDAAIQARMWEPKYLPYRRAG